MENVKLVTFADNLKDDVIFEVPYKWLASKLEGMSVKQFLSECTHYDTDEIFTMASKEDKIITIKEVEADI